MAVILQLYTNENATLNFIEIGISMAHIVIYLLIIAFLAYTVYNFNRWFPHRLEKFFAKAKTREAVFGISIIIAIGLSLAADFAGMHFIIGTFFAGLIFSEKIRGKKEADKAYGIMSGITFGFFAPLFFAIIGMKFSGQSLESSVLLLSLLVVLGIIGKTTGGFIGTKLCKFPTKEGLAVAALLNGRGTVGLSITALAYSIGILDTTLFSICVAVCLITTIITPLIAKPILNKIPSQT